MRKSPLLAKLNSRYDWKKEKAESIIKFYNWMRAIILILFLVLVLLGLSNV